MNVDLCVSPTELNNRGGGCVRAIEPHSLAARSGIQPGDVIVAVNGHFLRDVIDFHYYASEPHLEIVVRRGKETWYVTAERRFGEPLGISFAHPTFDTDIRRCVNRCEFCFVAQAPRGMRRELYIRDDDYRYSFLFGQFVTLTNLTEEDWQRIEEQHLSPLYVSVHTTERDLRCRILGKADAPDILEQLRWLAERNIEVHAQLVLIPGVNDGLHLERSVTDLVALYPAVRSIAIVPVGVTRHHAPGVRAYTPEEAVPLLEQVQPWQKRCREQLGVTLIYLSDEWYLLGGKPIPSTREYDEFAQLENGVGIVRRFLDEWKRLKSRIRRRQHRPRHLKAEEKPSSERVQSQDRGKTGIAVVCGRLAAPILRKVCAEMEALAGKSITVFPVMNNWYGGNVAVSGLLTGRDVIAQLQGEEIRGQTLLLPRVMFDSTGQVTLDDLTAEDIARALGTFVVVAQSPGDIWDVL
jgi:putative radical SAM enzyme (TIGR03279 family)